jgi:hypothetical protein
MYDTDVSSGLVRRQAEDELNDLVGRYDALPDEAIDERVRLMAEMVPLQATVKIPWYGELDLFAGMDESAMRDAIREFIAPEEPSACDTHPSACDTRDVSRDETCSSDGLASDGKHPRVRDTHEVSRRLYREISEEPEEGDRDHLLDSVRDTHGRFSAFGKRPRGDRSSRDLIFEQRIWVASVLASPSYVPRSQQIESFGEAFGLSRMTFFRRLAEIRGGWRPPFRRGESS